MYVSVHSIGIYSKGATSAGDETTTAVLTLNFIIWGKLRGISLFTHQAAQIQARPASNHLNFGESYPG